MASLVGKIHEIWEATDSLKATEVYTGRIPAEPAASMPYARIEQPAATRRFRSNRNIAKDVEIVFHVWTDTWDEGEALRLAIEAKYQNFGFDYDGGSVLDMIYDTHSSSQPNLPEYTTWETVITYSLVTEEPRAT
jgi:hypothetical protein